MKKFNHKQLLLSFILLTGVYNLNAQIGGFGMPNIFGNTGQQQQTAAAPDTTRPAAAAVAASPDEAQEVANKKLEIENKFIELQKQKIILEQELAQLSNTGDTTRQDSVNRAIKKKNLELLYMKEQLMLQNELEKQGYYNYTFPPSSVYGQAYFRNPKMRMIYTPSDISPSESYVLGTGDQIQVDIYGRAGYSGGYTVDEMGFVDIPKMQKVFVKGKSLAEVRSLLRTRFSQIVNLGGSNFDVSVSGTRTITVHVTGEVFNPGTYTLPALNSAFNILTLAGGPTDMGSMRNVFIQRGGVIVDSFDLYAYLFGGRVGGETFLQNNDFLIVPAVHKIVTIEGGVKREGKYELKNSEGFKDLLVFAAGFTAESYLQDMVVNRIVNNEYYDNISFNWDSLAKKKKDFLLFDGDKVNVKRLNNTSIYVAKIKGGVNTPGVYKIRTGEKITDLIARANGLHRDVYAEKAYLIRTNKDLTRTYFVFQPLEIVANPLSSSNLLLDLNDEIYIFTKQEYREIAFVSTEGFVRKPTKIEFVTGMKASDLINLSGGFEEKGYRLRALIERVNPDFTLSVLPIEFDNNNNIVKDVILRRNDVIKIYPKPTIADVYKVEVFGEVNKPGTLVFRENMTLKDLIIMSGGVKGTAEFSGIEIASVVQFDSVSNTVIPYPKTVLNKYTIGNNFDIDETSANIRINPMDQVFIRKAYFNEQKTMLLKGEVKYPGVYAISRKDETIMDVVERAGGFTEFAFLQGAEYRRIYKDTQSVRVIVNLNKAINRPNSRFNYFVSGNDSLIIPRIDQTVRITGQVENQSEEFISSYYAKGKRARYYVNSMAGGFNRQASKKSVYVQYANGQNVRTKNFLFFKVFPKVKTGSIIFVPDKSVSKGKKFNLDATLTKVLTTTTTVLTLFALINLATGK